MQRTLISIICGFLLVADFFELKNQYKNAPFEFGLEHIIFWNEAEIRSNNAIIRQPLSNEMKEEIKKPVDQGICEKEHQHLYSLKVHKAGSTSVQNLFLRLALARHLNVMTIFEGFMSYPHQTFDELLPPTPAGLTNGKYDIYCEHSIYNEEYLLTKLHADTVNIAILREPLSQLRSTFNFYHIESRLQLQNFADPGAEFLKKPKYFCEKDTREQLGQFSVQELTQNRIAREFGYNVSVHILKEYLSYIDSKFLVLIFERLTES